MGVENGLNNNREIFESTLAVRHNLVHTVHSKLLRFLAIFCGFAEVVAFNLNTNHHEFALRLDGRVVRSGGNPRSIAA
jgi:hypothetical protein